MFGSNGNKEPKGKPEKAKREPEQAKCEPDKPKCEAEKPKCKSEKPKCERDFEEAYRLNQHKMSISTGLCKITRQEWTDPFLEEELLGIAILQRQHRLVQKKQAIEQQQQQGEDDEKPPDYDLLSDTPTITTDIVPASTTTLMELRKELRELRGKYWEHHNRLRWFDLSPPVWKNSVAQIMILRNHHDRHNHSYAWVYERQRCAARGGCCGRTCGCCEKPLDQYLQPGDHMQGDDLGEGAGRRKVEVLGHCTVECACCIQFRDCYIPHPRLPPTAF